MKVKELINDIMAEKEVSEEKDSLISYEGSYILYRRSLKVSKIFLIFD